MTAIMWDKVGERTFQTGVDRGVLYLPDDTHSDGSHWAGVPWNGLVSVEEEFDRETKSYYMDGIKYLENQVLGDFAAKLTAFTYPDEFDQCNGIKAYNESWVLYDQKPTLFGLSYRTKIGNDIDGVEHSYKIHILYNLLATPDTNTYTTQGDQTDPSVFSWALSGLPHVWEYWLPGFRQTTHFSFNSNELDSASLTVLEGLLYGNDAANAQLPDLLILKAIADGEYA